MKSGDDLQALSPVQEYEAPKLPTLAEKPQLKKLPARWQKNAAVVACIGVVGTMTLASCASETKASPVDAAVPYSVTYAQTTAAAITGAPEETTEEHTAQEYTTAQEAATTAAITTQTTTTTQQTTMAITPAELDLRSHWGGSGAGPFYVVHLTEQEALGIIRTQLEAAGLRFGATPPNHTVEVVWVDPLGHGSTSQTTGLALLDANNNVAVALSERGGWFAEQTQQRFARDRQTRNLTIGTFYSPGEGIERDWRERPVIPPTAEEMQAHIPVLRANLTEQVQTFIEFLQAEGIL